MDSNDLLTRCQRPFWYVMGSIDIITDILTIVLPIMLVWGLQMSQGKKIAIGIAFAFRTLYVLLASSMNICYFTKLTTYLKCHRGGHLPIVLPRGAGSSEG